MKKSKIICALLAGLAVFSFGAVACQDKENTNSSDASGSSANVESSSQVDTQSSSVDDSSVTSVEYSVTFLRENGEVFLEKTVYKNGKVEMPINPERGGYVFVEWQKDGEKFDFSTSVTGDITLVARWGFTVAFDSAGGTEIPPVTVAEGDLLTPPQAPQKSAKETETVIIDYTFIAWKLDGVAFDFSTPITGNITLTASYESYVTKK